MFYITEVKAGNVVKNTAFLWENILLIFKKYDTIGVSKDKIKIKNKRGLRDER